MPQLVKGGKYVYGWSKVGRAGKIVIPNEAINEYNLLASKNAILIPGSKRSGGLGVTSKKLMKDSFLGIILDNNPQLAKFQIPEGDVIKINGKPYCWVKIQKDGSIIVPLKALKRYGINPDDWLLSVRGSNLAIGFPMKGPIIEEAKKHSHLERFE